MAIDTLYTSAGYNSFMDIATATTLIAARELLTGELSGWAGLTIPQQEAQLLEATRIVNSVDWSGTKNAGIVAPLMTWPRGGLYEATGEAVSDTTIPDQILNYMVCLIMYRLITGDPTAAAAGAGIQSKTVDKISITYRGSGSGRVSGADGCQATWIPSVWLSTSSSCMGVGSVSKMRCP